MINPTKTPKITEKATTARFSVKNMTTNCLYDKPLTLIMVASRLLSFMLTRLTSAVPTDAAKTAKTTPKRCTSRLPIARTFV